MSDLELVTVAWCCTILGMRILGWKLNLLP